MLSNLEVLSDMGSWLYTELDDLQLIDEWSNYVLLFCNCLQNEFSHYLSTH